MNTIERAWLKTGTAALLRDVPAEYLAECRYAFYAGVRALFDILDNGDSRSKNGAKAEVDAYFAAVQDKPRKMAK